MTLEGESATERVASANSNNVINWDWDYGPYPYYERWMNLGRVCPHQEQIKTYQQIAAVGISTQTAVSDPAKHPEFAGNALSGCRPTELSGVLYHKLAKV